VNPATARQASSDDPGELPKPRTNNSEAIDMPKKNLSVLALMNYQASA